MARRVLNRKQLRDEADQAARAAPGSAPEAESASPPKAKKSPARAAKKPRARKEPARLRARWGVFDNSMKRVAIFDYNQRAAADQKLVDLNARKGGLYFLQIVKEPIDNPDLPKS